MEVRIFLEKNLNRHDEFKGKCAEVVDEVLEINVGSASSPKMVKIGKNASRDEQRANENLIQEYKDVFACTYDDLKTYDECYPTHYPSKRRS